MFNESIKQALEDSNKAIARAKKIVGAKRLSEKTGITKQNICYWETVNTFPPLEKAAKICVATDGEVRLDELRPDLKPLFGELFPLLVRQSDYIETN